MAPSPAPAPVRRVPGDRVSHHPYALWSPPAIPSPDPNVVRIANIDRITRLTGRLVSRHRFAPERIGAFEDRFNVVGRVKGTGGGKSLSFNSHLDTIMSRDDTSRFM